jgi:hypothetical protein
VVLLYADEAHDVAEAVFAEDGATALEEGDHLRIREVADAPPADRQADRSEGRWAHWIQTTS